MSPIDDGEELSGTRFNGATAFSRGMCQGDIQFGRVPQGLQWGHGVSAVECDILHALGIGDGRASMEPRRFNRGMQLRLDD